MVVQEEWLGYAENGSKKPCQNSNKYLPINTASYTRRLECYNVYLTVNSIQILPKDNFCLLNKNNLEFYVSLLAGNLRIVVILVIHFMKLSLQAKA
jgi:hypothetical protein